jgi:hypothetical protein
MGYIGLYDCSWLGSGPSCPQIVNTIHNGSALIQAGWVYGYSYNGTSPDMFVELYGTFDLGTTYCGGSFCGFKIQENAGDLLSDQDTQEASDWYAYVQDVNNSQYAVVSDPTSAVDVGTTLPYVLVSMEALDASDSSWITTPMNFTLIATYGSGGEDTDPSMMHPYVGYTTGTGVDISSYSAVYACASCSNHLESNVTIS